MANISKVELNGTTYNINTSGSIPESEKGAANGVASLDSSGKVPSYQLPSYVDDVLEYSAKSSFPATGETGKIYVDTSSNKTYRWSGSAYVEISESLALGDTSSTAYRGDRGKAAYNHSQSTHARTDATKTEIINGKLAINGTATDIGNFKAVSTVASQELSNTEKSNARANIGAQASLTTAQLAAVNSGINSTKVGQISTNQTNILYVSNQIGKNILDARSYEASGQATGITVTVNDDCSVTLNGTSSSSNNVIYGYFDADVKPNTRYAMKGTGNNNVKVQLIGYNDINNPTLVFNDVNDNVGSSGNWQHYRVRLWIAAKPSSGTQFSNVTIYPMLCPEELWNISHDFAPYALPNYDLTRLESEDRAGLIDVVDSGAKNLLDLSSTDTSSITKSEAITITRDSANEFTITRAASPTAVQEVKIPIPTSFPTNKYVILSGCPSNGAYATYSVEVWENNRYLSDAGGDYGSGTKEFKFSTTTGRFIRIRFGDNTSFSNLKFKFMCCTKAAFGVSQKFVPYAKSNYQLTTDIGNVNAVLEAVL